MAKSKGTFVVPRNFDHEGKRFATKVNESIAQLKGEIGNPLDSAVTFRDLIDAGIAKRDIRIGANGNIIGGGTGGIVIGDEDVLEIPPAPTGVSADGAFQNIVIEWDVPTFFGFSHAEVWAATTSNFADRVFIGQTTAAVFSHQVGNGQTRYYWIRFVNIQDTVGPFNSTTGTQASTAPDIAALMTELSETLQDLPGYQTLNSDLSNITDDILDLQQDLLDEANAASRVIKSTSAPTTRGDGSSLQPGDIWIDTDDNNQMYVRNASNNGWTKARDSSLISLYNTLSSTVSTNSTNIATAQSDIITLTTDTSSNATAITNLQSSLSTTNSNVSANSSSISSLTTQVQSNDSDISSLSSSLTSLTTTVNTINGDYATGTALNALTSRVTTNEGDITSINSSLTSLTTTVNTINGDYATGTALTTLTSRVSTNESSITSINSSITSLQSQITANDGDISGNATAISGLDTRVTSAEGTITSQASSITQLQTDVGTNSASVTSLQTSVTNLEGDAQAAYVLQVQANGSVAGMVIEANASGATTGTAVQFVSDKFAIWNGTSGTAPFIVSGGTVFIKDAMIQNGAITNAKIGNLAVDTAKIANLAITEAKMANLSVATAKIQDLAVDNAKIANLAVTNAKINDLNATKINAGLINSDRINVDTLNVKHFDDVSTDIKSHLTGGTTFFPLGRSGQNYVQRTGTYTGSNASFIPVTITQVRNNATYIVIFSGVLGDVSGGRVQYSLNNSTWVNANGNTNISWSAGTYRGYTYVYTGQITTLSASQSTVYWRVYFSGSYNHTQLSLNVIMDNTQ